MLFFLATDSSGFGGGGVSTSGGTLMNRQAAVQIYITKLQNMTS